MSPGPVHNHHCDPMTSPSRTGNSSNLTLVTADTLYYSLAHSSSSVRNGAMAFGNVCHRLYCCCKHNGNQKLNGLLNWIIRLVHLRLTFLETAIHVMWKTDRCLTHKTTHKRWKWIVAGHTELMLNVNHCLRRFHDDVLIVITQFCIGLKCGHWLGHKILQHTHYVRFYRTGCDCGCSAWNTKRKIKFIGPEILSEMLSFTWPNRPKHW